MYCKVTITNFSFAFILGIAYTTIVKTCKIVIDTNVIVSGLYSNRGASYKLLELLDNKNIQVAVSVSIILEYEEVLLRNLKKLGFIKSDIENFLDYFCDIADKREIYFLWRPFLKDLKDDMVLELAVESGSDYIITYNIRDFQGSEKFGIKVLTPKEFLKILEKTPSG